MDRKFDRVLGSIFTGDNMSERMIQYIAVVSSLLVAFPTIGVAVMDSILTGILLGVFIAMMISIMLFYFWYRPNQSVV